MKVIPSSTTNTMGLINLAFQFVVDNTRRYSIDESHGLKHAMEVYNYAKQNYENQVVKYPFLEEQKNIIFTTAIGHDMCDKKYVDESTSIASYQAYLSPLMTTNELEIIGKIIETMSYSKVKVQGFPDLGINTLAYHIIREADLLAGYDIDRCIIYSMSRDKTNYTQSLMRALNLFETRVFTMREDKLFITDFGKQESLKLHKKAKKTVTSLRNILD